jgi:hypothetical protein
MPATSERQRKFFGAVRSYMEDGKRQSASPEVRKVARTMKIREVRDMTRKARRG